ncbi:MAG: LCP family protein [Anaerolineaceae bacterium]|jgi:LCP family protein required for cell wall assembly
MHLKKYQVTTLVVFTILTITIIGVIVVGMVVGAMVRADQSSYRFSLSGNPPTPTPFQPRSFADAVAAGLAEHMPQPVFTPTPVPTIPVSQLPTNQMNILLLGVDDFGDNNFRTDVIILLSVNPKHNSVSMVSFPRDLYVSIPGYWSNRINTAWGLGGWSLLQDTFEVNFGIRPEYYMMVNYDGFKYVINSIGGIDIEVTQELQDECSMDPSGWCTLQPGMTHMDSNLALWYARSRKTTSDFDRNRRAQEVVQAIFHKGMSLNSLSKAPELYRAYREYVDTNLKFSELVPLAPMAPALLNNDNVHRYAVTPDMAYDFITAEGAMVLMPNIPAIQSMLSEALYRNE